LFIYTEKEREMANKLYLSLRNGIASYPGCKRLTGISIERDNVIGLKIPNVSDDKIAQAYFDEIQNYLQGAKVLPDFAFILYSRQPRSPKLDPYCTSKVALSKHGIPSQYVSLELLDSSNTFQYAISNIALAFFVKLGGIPWSVSIGRKAPTLVLGIGSTEIEDKTSNTRRRYIGFSVCILSNGLYLDTEFFPASNSYAGFLDNMSQGLRNALNRMLKIYGNVEKVTIHISHLEKNDTVQLVKNTLRQYEQEIKTPIPFEFIRLTGDSDFMVYDLAHSGFVSEEGTVVNLSHRHSLLVTEGREEKAVWRGRKPITLELHREYSSNFLLPMQDSVEDAFRLSALNWRGFNAVTQPISLQYSKLLAAEIAKLSQVDSNICNIIQHQPSLTRTPWFI